MSPITKDSGEVLAAKLRVYADEPESTPKGMQVLMTYNRMDELLVKSRKV